MKSFTLKKPLFIIPLKLTFTFFLVAALLSCESKMVEVSVSNAIISSQKIVIDDTLVLKVKPDSKTYSTLQLSTGSHSFSINGTTKQNFKVGDEGGILNLNQQEFVIYPITYSNTTAADINHDIVNLNYPIIIDSFIVYNRGMVNAQSELISFLKNENIKDFLNRDIIKTPANQLFINKTWDYNVDQEPSDSISVKVETKDTKTHGFRKKILDSRTFLLYAMLGKEYIVEPVQNKKEIQELLNNTEK
jgi:hypothetical protein